MFFIDTLVRQWLNGKPLNFDPYVTGDVLDLRGLHMSELPYNLYTLKNIKEANFRGLGLKTVKHIDTLPLLEKLDLSHNQLNNLSDLNNPRLAEIDASFNQINTLSGFNCKSIKKLRLNYNRLHEVDELLKFPKLTELDISGNPIPQLNWLGYNTHRELERLVCRQNFLERIGFNSGKCRLPALRELDLSSSRSTYRSTSGLLSKIDAQNLEMLILNFEPPADILKNFPKATVVIA